MNIVHKENGDPNESALARLKPCPRDKKLPDFDHNQTDGYIFRCHHGYEMSSHDLDKAVDYWNRVMAFVMKETLENMADHGHGRADQSFCMACQKPTYTRVTHADKIYRAECADCHLPKLETK